LNGVGLRTIAGGSLHLRDDGTRKQAIGAINNTKLPVDARSHRQVSPGASRSVSKFDWEYYLLLACSLAFVVLGAIFILFLAM
jgi:hypothetical protein